MAPKVAKTEKIEPRDLPGDDMVMQFKVTLREIEPPVWRRIQLPAESTFWDLHVAIQNAFGWADYHLHEFRVADPMTGAPLAIGIPDEYQEFGSIGQFPGWLVRIDRTFVDGIRRADYLYDFGDAWMHTIRFERLLRRDKRHDYPRCVKGARKCPPEDCGGPGGYARLLEALADRRHPCHRELKEWVGGTFDPEEFDPAAVVFEDPQDHLDKVFPLDDEDEPEFI